MATGSQWLLFTCLLGLCAAWMDERPVLESRDGNLFISAAKDRNITLKILGKGHVNVNEINLLHVATAADSATRLIERWKTGYLAEVEANLQRLSQIVEGPDGLERRLAMMKPFTDGNTTIQPDNSNRNQSAPGTGLRFRVLSHRIRRVEDKVKSIEAKLQRNDCASNPCLHEGLCLDLYDGYQCKCPSTWEGPNCEIDVNECVRLLGTDLGCQNGATCHNLEGSYRCDCAPGWFGIHCTKKTSICNTQNSEELCGHGVCVSKTGSPLGYTCICDQGWQSDGTNPACVKDVNECIGNHRPCSVNPWVDCRNAPGTFFCDACPRGYTGNGYYCADIDECQFDNGGCSTSPRVDCINTMGSRTCGACPTGYRGDGVTCVYVGGCAINNGGCHPLATCEQNEGLSSAYVICRCPTGMVGDGFGPNGCQSSPYGIFPNGCRSNPCLHGRCIPGGLKSGYTCVCNPGFSGPTCSIPTDSCYPNPCKNNGVCLISNGVVTCNCPSTHTGSRCENQRQACGGVSRNPVGHLKFPEGGNVYQHGLSCAWVLVTNSSLVLNVTFTAFNLEQSTDCKYDFLQIHDGRNAASQMIGRFCGNLLPHVNGSIVSSHNSLYFWFHSDSSVNHDGFEFHWNSISPVCGGQLNGDYGTISSPGSPGRYPPNRDCYWTIQVRPSKRIQIHFGELMLEEHPTCDFDFLEITTIHNEQLARYCNHTQPPPLAVPSSGAIVHFHSDSAGQDAGFQIHYSIIEGIPGCNDVYTAPTGTINSPVNVESYVDLECEWKIQMPVGKRVRVTWVKFELDNDKCATENVKIYDGGTSESRLMQRYCSSNLPPAVKSTSNVMLIVFTSNQLKKGSFSLSYNVMCGSVYTEESGIIHSANYPYETNVNNLCTYEIQQPPNRRIVLRLLDADIKGLHTSSCYPSSLRIYDGPNENSTIMANLCGSDIVSGSDDLIYYSTFNTMFIKYTSMMYMSSKERGFLANYTTILNRCGGLYTETTGSIQMPATGQTYAPNEDCIWTIQAPIGYVIRLTWLSFDLEVNAKCRFDHVSVYENYMVSDKELIGTFCGKKIPPVLLSQGNTMTVVFRSDSTINRDGFVATYLFVDQTKICGGHFLKRTGVITSPNYPQRYPHRKECTWKIEAPNRQRVILNITHFELEGHSGCIFDYLEIRNGGYETSPLIGKYCGTKIPTEIISQTNQLYLKFVCDSSRAFSGFRIEWDSTTSGCGGTLNAANGDIISPNYPQPYMHQAECYWTIAVAEGSLVQLIIVDLQLENHARCNFDFIEISEKGNYQKKQRYCDSPYPRVIQMNSNIVNIQFRSDYTNSGRGFHLKYETLCHNKVHGFYGVIESPNFPNKYEHNMNCSWTIDAPIGNNINLTFSHFDMEGSGKHNSCEYDYLEISEGTGDMPETQLAKLCNSDVLPAKIHSSLHQVFLTFITDDMFAFNGFRLEWLIDGCGGYLTRPTGGFTSPGYPSSYPTDIECEWLIEVNYGHIIELTIHDLNTEKQNGCSFDKLEIYNGGNDQGQKLIDICYSEKPVVYTSFGNKMFAKFHSDVSYAARGFNATYKTIAATCGGRYTAHTGIIHSTNYPQNYPHRQNCEWLLEVDENYVVNISFLDFDIEFTGNCTHDYVNIYDGPTRNSPLLGSHCKDELPPSYVSTSNQMLVVMVTNSIMSAKGFKARYSKACGARIIVKDTGFLTPTPNYSSETDESTNCTWILIAENPGDHVTVTFTNMEMSIHDYWDQGCAWNFIEVFEGASTSGPSRGKWCESTVPLPVTSTGNALTVHLYSIGDYPGHFSLTYSSLNSACGGTYASFVGKISSPDYPNTYPLNVECVWILTNSPGNKLSLTFSEFELQKSDHCDLDYLEIREVNGIGKLIGTFCGTSIEPVQSNQTLWIKFKSDGDDVGKGFVAEYRLTGGDELTGPTGRITSPLYPTPYKTQDTNSWRITVEFGWSIRIKITDMFVENYYTTCYSAIRVYDGYDNDAPILLESCGSNLPEPITTTSNVAYIELSTELIRHGNWFDLTWIQMPRYSEEPDDTEHKFGDCNEIVTLDSRNNSSFMFNSPNYPREYNSSLECNWLMMSPPGTHLVLRIEEMDLEETSECAADYVAVYDGDALNPTGNANLLQRMCLANSTAITVDGSNLMTVKFVSDGYVEKTGFRAIIYNDCGGKLTGPNGVIDANNWTTARMAFSWQVRCEWTIEVKRGRTIEVKIEQISIPEGPNSTCGNYYIMLKNGGDEMSPLLGTGKYCGEVAPAPLETTGNRLYVKAYGIRSHFHFKLTYREVSMHCGGEFVLSDKQKEWQISTPNYPNIPPPFSECTWRVIAPNKERIVIHFIERFDLSNSANCDREFVEVRDGGTDSSKLFGRYCKNMAPSSMTSTGNMMFVHFYTDLPEPKNGFKAVFAIGEACGGIIRGSTGIISSPDYPFFYPKNQTCGWTVVAPKYHTINFQFLDINLPGLRRCKVTDHVTISDILTENDTRIDIGTYCGSTQPDNVETMSNQAFVQFVSDNIQYTPYRGFNMKFESSREVCGGEFTAMQGIIKSNGYPNLATDSRYCYWKIKLPLGFQVVAEVLDLDVATESEMRIGHPLSFYNDLNRWSKIVLLSQNSTMRRVQSSSNTMVIGYYSTRNHRGFKLRYSAVAPAPCGGDLQEISGNITAPKVAPFNESSYFCRWKMVAPQSMINSTNSTGVTLTLKATGLVGGIKGIYTKHCFNYQYIHLIDAGKICGNLSEPMYLRSPKLVNDLVIVNGTYGQPANFNLKYQWQPCGGILEGMSHVIQAPKNISFPISCVWHSTYSDYRGRADLSFTRFHLGSCDKNYISIRSGGPYSAETNKFCGANKPRNITITSYQLWIEYMASEEPNDFEFILQPVNSGCGGTLRGRNREISSPKFPSLYPNNAECTWIIDAGNGYHIGLVFVERFHLENSANCEKDYVQAFDWITDADHAEGGYWKDLGKVCGRTTPNPFNSTTNRMKVTFRSNEAVQADGFRAVWHENCGGIFQVDRRPKFIQSPSYPGLYPPRSFCNYTFLAPEKSVIVEFVEFELEFSRRDCRYDNLTMIMEGRYGGTDEAVFCGTTKPPAAKSPNRMEIIFQSDDYTQRNGFSFKYYLDECGGTLTKPGEIRPLMNGSEYYGGLHCTWKIQAPTDKNVVVRFESFDIEQSYRCLYDNVEVYDGPTADDDKRLAMVCGNLSKTLPVFRSTSNSMVVKLNTDDSRNHNGFSAKVLFVKGMEAGCGGDVELNTTQSYSFRTQTGATYDNFEDCHWTVKTSLQNTIKLTINTMDVKNATNRRATDDSCTGDYLEIRDGYGPFSELLGKYCGNVPPPPILSGTNRVWIRFFSDGTLEGAGVSGTLEMLKAPCPYAEPIINDTAITLTTPNYPSGHLAGIRCRWLIQTEALNTEKIRVQFVDFDLADSATCEDEYLEITDSMNRKFIEEGFGEDFVWNGDGQHSYYMAGEHTPTTMYKYCGSSLPHDYYSYSSTLELTFKSSSHGNKKHRGFKLEYGSASCDRNYTAEQGRIIHESIEDCWITITAPENHTISLYFNQFMLYDPTQCTASSLQVFDGDFNGNLLATLCAMDTPNPIFSNGNKLSLHSRSAWHTTFEYYDITFTTTSAGRGCGGRLYNYAGTFSSPLYPNEYRNNTECSWDLSVPRGLKVSLEFTVFDIGTKNTCSLNYNILEIFDVTESGLNILATTFCGGDDPAPFVASGNRVIVTYTSSMNNVGTGWLATFKAVTESGSQV